MRAVIVRNRDRHSIARSHSSACSCADFLPGPVKSPAFRFLLILGIPSSCCEDGGARPRNAVNKSRAQVSVAEQTAQRGRLLTYAVRTYGSWYGNLGSTFVDCIS